MSAENIVSIVTSPVCSSYSLVPALFTFYHQPANLSILLPILGRIMEGSTTSIIKPLIKGMKCSHYDNSLVGIKETMEKGYCKSTDFIGLACRKIS